MGGVFKSTLGLVKTATGYNQSQKAGQTTKATRTSPADVVRKIEVERSHIGFSYLIALCF